MALTARLVLALVPTLVGISAWAWLEEAFRSSSSPGLSPFWIYYWHPPLMDALFGAVVLASFVRAPPCWWCRAAFLGLVSFLVHTIAVIAVVNTQWLLDPFIDVRFVSVLPVALIATLALTSVTAAAARFVVTPRLLACSVAAGVGAGVTFLLALEIDTTGHSWFWRYGVQWMIWHASVCAAIYLGSQQRHTGARIR